MTDVLDSILIAIKANGETLVDIHETLELAGAEAHMQSHMQSHTNLGAITLMGSPSPRVVPLSYMLLEQQLYALGAPMGVLIGGLFFGAPIKPGGLTSWTAHDWSKKTMTVRDYGRNSQASSIFLEYTYLGMDQDASEYSRGDEKVMARSTGEVPGKAYLIDLAGEEAGEPDFEFERETSVSLSASSSTEMDHTTEIDVGVKSDTKATVGGDAEGGKLEQEIEATFGYKDSDETAKTEAHDKTTTETIKIAQAFESGSDHLAVVDEDDIHSDTKRGWHGVTDYAITLRIPLSGTIGNQVKDEWGWDRELSWYPVAAEMRRGSRYSEKNGYAVWSWADMSELLSTLDGTDTELPNMVNYGTSRWFAGSAGRWANNSSYRHDMTAARDAIADGQKSRRIDFDGTEHRDYKSAPRFTVSDVTGQDIDALIEAHGATRVTREGEELPGGASALPGPGGQDGPGE